MSRALIVTDRTSFERAWTPLFSEAGLVVDVLVPERFPATVARGRVALIDGGSQAYDEDELLAHVTLARALGVATGVALPHAAYADVEDLLDDLCAMRVARREDELPRVVASLVRAAAALRRARFEYLTVSPRSDALLAAMADGSAVLVPRGTRPGDGGAEVDSISLSDDATVARVALVDGTCFEIAADDVAPRPRVEPSPSSSGTFAASAHDGAIGPAVDGARLGARVRELRRAAGLTQAELARRTGIHRPNIARVEAGRHTPSLETLARLAAAIGVPTATVLAVDDDLDKVG